MQPENTQIAAARDSPRAAQKATAGQVISIQYLRAIASLMVVIVHMSVQLRRLGYQGAWPDWLGHGVDIFFVISGFVMWITGRPGRNGPATFYRRRLARIVPLYWLLTTFTVVMMVAMPSVVQSGRFEVEHVVMSYFFLPAQHPLNGMIQPVLEPGWTLNYEMYFYFMFGAVMVLPDRGLAFATILWLGASLAIGVFGPASNEFVQFYGSSIIVEFAFGMATGAAFRRGWFLPKNFALMFLVLGIFGLSLSQWINAPRGLITGIPALAIVMSAIALENHHGVRKLWAVVLLGDASFALYLSHGLVLSACEQIGRIIRLNRYAWAIPGFFVGGLLTAIAVAIFIHLLIERPLTRHFSATHKPVHKPVCSESG